MNNKIKELAKIAELYYCEETEQFAHAIIDECVSAIKNWKNEPFPFDEDGVALIIKNHFKD